MTAKRKVKFTRYDAADYLKTHADMAEFLIACFEEAPDDPAYIAEAIGTVTRAYGMTKMAKETGLSREGLCKAFSQDGNPSLATVLKVMQALGLKLTPSAAH